MRRVAEIQGLWELVADSALEARRSSWSKVRGRNLMFTIAVRFRRRPVLLTFTNPYKAERVSLQLYSSQA